MDAAGFSGKIIVGLCTFARHEPLKEALDSLSRVKLPQGAEVEFVLVDNEKDAGARYIFDAYAEDMPFKCHYFVEENSGLSYVRNRVIEEALNLNATAIAMFDDDEIVDDMWLVELCKAFKERKCDGVCGTVYRLLPPCSSKFVKKFWPNGKYPPDVTVRLMATGNCLFSANLVRPDGLNIRFDNSFNFSGREDLAFSFDAQLKGARFIAAPEAIVIEKFPEKRATFGYLLGRWFDDGVTDVKIARRYKFGRVWRTVKEMLRVPLLLLAIPLMTVLGPTKQGCAVLRIAASLGWFCGLLGMSSAYYRQNACAASREEV